MKVEKRIASYLQVMYRQGALLSDMVISCWSSNCDLPGWGKARLQTGGADVGAGVAGASGGATRFQRALRRVGADEKRRRRGRVRAPAAPPVASLRTTLLPSPRRAWYQTGGLRCNCFPTANKFYWVTFM